MKRVNRKRYGPFADRALFARFKGPPGINRQAARDLSEYNLLRFTLRGTFPVSGLRP